MKIKEVTTRKWAKWNERGKPTCAVCHQPVHGKLNYAQWKQTGKCYGCQGDIDQVHYNQWKSVPPPGIRKE